MRQAGDFMRPFAMATDILQGNSATVDMVEVEFRKFEQHVNELHIVYHLLGYSVSPPIL